MCAFQACENLRHVYYGGTAADWEAIEISQTENEMLFQPSVTICFYSEAQPDAQDPAVYWHYDSDGMPVLWSAAGT